MFVPSFNSVYGMFDFVVANLCYSILWIFYHILTPVYYFLSHITEDQEEVLTPVYYFLSFITEDQEEVLSPVSEMDTNVYNPPDTLQIPPEACQSDSAYSCPESDSSSSHEASTSPDVRY